MEVLSLRVRVTQDDLVTLVEKFALPADNPIEKLSLAIQPDGIVVAGYYPFFISVKFELRWQLSAVENKVQAQLVEFKAMGVPAGIFRSAIVKLLEDAAQKEPALEVQGDILLVDLDRLLSQHLCPITTHPRSVQMLQGEMILEAGVG